MGRTQQNMLSVSGDIVNKCFVESMFAQINCGKYNLEKQFFIYLLFSGKALSNFLPTIELCLGVIGSSF